MHGDSYFQSLRTGSHLRSERGHTPAIDFEEMPYILTLDILEVSKTIKREKIYGKTSEDRISWEDRGLSDITGRMSVSQSGLARSNGRFDADLVGNKSLSLRLEEIESMLSP